MNAKFVPELRDLAKLVESNFRPQSNTTDGERLRWRGKTKSIMLSLCILFLSAIFSPIAAHPANAPTTNSSTGSAFVNEGVVFTSTGSMNTARYRHTATLLNSGNVLVAGGLGGDNSAELYDPVQGTWSRTGSMSTARDHPTATLLNNGKVLVAGGLGGDNSAELYDPVSGAWSSTGSMSVERECHIAILLNNGKVLVAGGTGGGNSAELYDPAAGTWSSTGGMNAVRCNHGATLLTDGRVLVTGGYSTDGRQNSAELYDPETGMWSSTSRMSAVRELHTATLLNNGKVLVAGGWDDRALNGAELYDPATGTWSNTGSMGSARAGHTATLLHNGKVLVAGGWDDHALNGTELYDPATGVWTRSGSMNSGRSEFAATLLNNGKVLVTGGYSAGDSAEIGTLMPANTFTGTLTLPSPWANSNPVPVQFVATTSGGAPDAGALSNDGSTWGDWIAASPGVTTTTAWNVGSDGINKAIVLRLRDVNGQVATVVTGTVNVDTTKPTSSMTALPAFSNSSIALSWSGSDALSGVASYDLQVRAGLGGIWTDVLTNTTSISTTFNGANGTTYYFRVHASDVAGNVEDWHTPYDAFTVVDTDAPTGTLAINGGATSTNALAVSLNPSASDLGSGVAQMNFSNDGSTWSAWQPYVTTTSWTLVTGDGLKTVYARFKDGVGNVSSAVSATITLDTIAPTGSVMIAGGATYATSTSVLLSLDASDDRSGVAQMSFSNDGSGWSAWENYATSKAWTLATGDGSKTVYARFSDNAGNISANTTNTITLDITAPVAAVTALNAYQATLTFPVSWSGNDTTSGLFNYDIQVRDGAGGTWTDWITATTAISSSFTGQDAHTYYFRARARDNAGNVSVYSSSDTQTTVDVTAPTPGVLVINSGALSSTSINVVLSVLATDSAQPTKPKSPRILNDMSFSNDGDVWSNWQPYATSANWSLLSGDGLKTVYARFRDVAGNVSTIISSTITLDTAAGTQYGVSINDGALFTNQISVTLKIGALPGTPRMMVSNDGGFSGAQWEPYDSRKAWTITQYGSYVIPRVVYVRYGDTNGNVLNTSSDDIILDVTPPTGSVSIVGTSGSAPRTPRSVILALSATDDVSGVGSMMLSNRADFVGANWQAYATSATWTLGSNNTVYARFKDNAGNVSQTYSATLGNGYKFWLPFISR